MPAIRPVSDLRNNYNEIEKIIQEQEVFLTKNGVGASVIMSIEAYDRLQTKLNLYAKITEVENDIANGDRGQDIDKAFADIRSTLKNDEN